MSSHAFTDDGTHVPLIAAWFLYVFARCSTADDVFLLPFQFSDSSTACGEPRPVEENGGPQTELVLTDEDRNRIVENHRKALERRAIKMLTDVR